MKKILVVLGILMCMSSVYANNNLEISNVEYKTYDCNGNVQTGTINFTTTYIYDVEEI